MSPRSDPSAPAAPGLLPVVLVTGAAGGIGAALVRVFEAAGWQVVSTDRSELARPGHVRADMEACADPAHPDHAAVLAQLRAATGGRLKALVANAAHQVVKPCAELTAQDWQRSLGVNLMAPFWLAMAFADELAAQRGSFLAISSIHERLTKPGFVAYATSKAALSGLTRALAVEMGHRVRCNAICPAAIATPMLRAGFEGRAEAYAALEAFHPVGRLGNPDEVARAALYACSDDAGFLNGSCLDLSGGIGARLHDPL
jgi:NAD(P)-dependent dehydrogenase (short-subunit alcohol dehydrogenase family)